MTRKVLIYKGDVVKLVKLIMGLKGSGKTKQLIELVRKADRDEAGAVVFVTKGSKLIYDIPRAIRFIDTSQIGLESYEFLKGFICGVFSTNYDITHFFIDRPTKILGLPPDAGFEGFLEWCEGFSGRENVKFTITISADIALATDKIKKYF